MPNKVKDTVEFFPFFVKDGRTLYVMQRKYGLAGIGFFTQVMRILGQTPGHYFTYVEDYDKDRLNDFCGMSETDVRAMITDMVRTGKLDRELWEERNVIYSQDFVDNLEELYRKRKADIPSRESVIEETAAIFRQYDANMPETSGNIPNRVEESRGEYSREEDTRSTPTAEANASNAVATIDRQTQKPKAATGDLKDTIAAKWEKALTQITPSSTWGNYGKERKACNTLAQRTRDLVDQTPYESTGELIEAVVSEYTNMKQRGRSSYWRNAPFTPSQVLNRWSAVWDSLAQQSNIEEMPF